MKRMIRMEDKNGGENNNKNSSSVRGQKNALIRASSSLFNPGRETVITGSVDPPSVDPRETVVRTVRLQDEVVGGGSSTCGVVRPSAGTSSTITTSTSDSSSASLVLVLMLVHVVILVRVLVLLVSTTGSTTASTVRLVVLLELPVLLNRPLRVPYETFKQLLRT